MDNKIKDFVIHYQAVAEQAGSRFGMNPLAILAQGALESGWGTSVSALNRHNFFGMLATPKTNEFWSGKKSQASTKLWFRVYDNPQQSFNDFARLITSNKMYANAVNVSHDIKAYAKAISQSPYISESNGDNRADYERNIIWAAAQIEHFYTGPKA